MEFWYRVGRRLDSVGNLPERSYMRGDYRCPRPGEAGTPDWGRRLTSACGRFDAFRLCPLFCLSPFDTLTDRRVHP